MKMTPPSFPARGVRGVFGSILGGSAIIVIPDWDVIGGAIGGALARYAHPGQRYHPVPQLQNQIQKETLAFETASTVLKVRHDVACMPFRT